MPQNSTPAQPPASHAVPVRPLRFASGLLPEVAAEVAVEAPVNIVYGTMPYAVMMASPADLEDFVAGFSLTEGIIRGVDEIRGIVVTPKEEGIEVAVELAPGRFREHLARRRNLSGRTSCGLCGVETLEEVPMAREQTGDEPPIALGAIEAALEALTRHQPLNRLTRSVHAAAWCDRDGKILAAREDVGRHNALDKLIGARLRAGHDARGGFVLVTSRASFEMVEKTAIFGAGALVTISAPTSLAIERAKKLGLTLVSVARDDAAILFAGKLAEELETEAR
ncbi:formate dehydrogenase accessory sulfurtransferase FdhD [Bosea caraganae]|uniref:Sulfur carrier protein FdhD n=1 Tax=Bosea caraganae TaxID=2763117 RepID=A0A370LCY7_9HYPH|nr:formate dehydrogenase accessory sulfurtransferase FdhD [Bosea caraganae]RDJ27824.1 formate dehydrogenase accessory sulfurtransferase FdhD [Bosea caraganae]RDJ29837.1 formate dehydrogenase accessory sulfurtransferase FdhD [Bosea caraganae]